MTTNLKKCPKCDSQNIVKIFYGMPNLEAFLQAQEGKIHLGGCCITDSDPEYHCDDCAHEWRGKEKRNG